jgi:hypothetical protein
MGAELRQTLVYRKEKYLKTEAVMTKLEEVVDNITKQMQIIQNNFRIEQATNTLSQVNLCIISCPTSPTNISFSSHPRPHPRHIRSGSSVYAGRRTSWS